MGSYRPRVALDLFSSLTQSAIGRWVCGFHSVRGGSTRGITVFVPVLSQLLIYGVISEPGMGIYPPRVRRDRGVSPRGNSRRARLALTVATGGRGEALGQ